MSNMNFSSVDPPWVEQETLIRVKTGHLG